MNYLDIITNLIPLIICGYVAGYYMASKISKLRQEFLHFKIDIIKYIDKGDELNKDTDGN